MGTNYKHLSCEERTLIQLILEQSCTLRAIARRVQRVLSVISRELERNAWLDPPTGARKRGRPTPAKKSRTACAAARRQAGEKGAIPIAFGPK